MKMMIDWSPFVIWSLFNLFKVTDKSILITTISHAISTTEGTILEDIIHFQHREGLF